MESFSFLEVMGYYFLVISPILIIGGISILLEWGQTIDQETAKNSDFPQ